jgi:hypothetical protein
MLAGFGDLKQRADMFIDLDTDPRVDPPARGTERATLATLDPWRGAVSLRWVVVHMVEEYAGTTATPTCCESGSTGGWASSGRRADGVESTALGARPDQGQVARPGFRPGPR